MFMMRKLKKLDIEVLSLKQKVEILYKENGQIKFDLEECEVKKDAVEEEKAAAQEEFDDLLKEHEELKMSLNNLEKDLDKVSTERKSIKKQFENFKKAESVKVKEKSDLIYILENTLANKESENAILKEELDKGYVQTNVKENESTIKSINDFDEDLMSATNLDTDSNTATTSAVKSLSCEQCDHVVESESDMKSHQRISHEWKCHYCDAIEFDEYDLEAHVNEKHEFECEFCGFGTPHGVDFDKHMVEKHTVSKHPYTCNTCELTCRTKDKIEYHICKADVKNPTFETLYTKNWYNKNGCNPVYCTIQNRDVAWMHVQKCWSEDMSCFGPYSLARKLVKHFKTEEVISNGVISWSSISEETRNAVYSDT